MPIRQWLRRSGSRSRRISTALVVVAFLSTAANSSGASEGPLTLAARELVSDLGAPSGVLVVPSPLTSDVPAPRGDELSERVASLVASALGPATRTSPRPMSIGAARALAGKTGGLLYVDVRVAEGELRLTADLYPVVANVWDRVRSPSPPPTKHGYVHPRVAAEVRSYLAPVRLEQARVTKFRHDLGLGVLAVACGDLEGDGGEMLVMLSGKEVAYGRLANGRFVVKRSAPASSLGRRLPVPLRQPIGSALIAEEGGTGVLYVGSTSRVASVVGPDLVPKRSLAGLPVSLGSESACLAPSAGKGAFVGFVDCHDGTSAPSPVAPVPVFDAWSAADISAPDGSSTRVIASRDPFAVLHLIRGHDSLTMSDVGAEVAVADLDQDGVAEIVTTSATGEDALVVSSWRPGGLEQRLRFPAPAGISAIAVCPPEANDAPAIVAAVGGEIWLVR